MSAHSRNKGKRGERELAGRYRAAGFDAVTGRQHRGGPDSPDVRVHDLPLLHVEVKRRKRQLDPYTWMSQAKAEAGEGQTAVVHMRRDHCEWLVVLELEDWFRICREMGVDKETT